MKKIEKILGTINTTGFAGGMTLKTLFQKDKEQIFIIIV
jgi:hypothetical protein